MLKKFINTLTEKVNIIKEENNHYKQLLETTTTFRNLFPIPQIEHKIQEHRITNIINDCPDINKDKAILISNIIPIEETFLSIIYSKEVKTNEEYYIIPTNKYLWIINPKQYGVISYTNNISCQIIKNNIIGKTILINNILLDTTGNDTKINTLINILTNPTLRETIIKEKTNYLCGIIPTYQKINSIYSGISLDNNSNIVLHNKVENLKSTTDNILYYEILLDNTVIYSNKNNTANKITNFQNSCYQITVRVTTKDNQIINLPILEPNSFNTKYERHDTIFQTNLNFAKELIDKLESLNKNKY